MSAGSPLAGGGIGVARPEDDDFIKRVVALEGDTWEIRRGRLFVNGARVREPYLSAERDTGTSDRDGAGWHALRTG